MTVFSDHWRDKKRHSCSDKHYSGNLVPSITVAVARDGAEAGSAHIVLQNSPTVVTGNGFHSGQLQPSCCISARFDFGELGWIGGRAAGKYKHQDSLL